MEEALKNACHWRFGRKSEAFRGEQRDLFDEDIEADAADIEQQLAALLPEPKQSPAATPKRRPLPPKLPREDIHLAPVFDSCPDCGHALRFIRDEISEQLEYVPARFIVHRHIRPQFSCEHCDTVVSAALSAQMIEKRPARSGPAGAGGQPPVDAVNSAESLRIAVSNQRRGAEIQRRFYANTPGYDSTSGGQQRSDKVFALSTEDAVYAAGGSYVRSYCVSGIQGN